MPCLAIIFDGRETLCFDSQHSFAPPIAVIIPFFLLFRDLKMLDSHITLIIVYLTFNLSFVIWLMRGFLMKFLKS